MVAFDNRHRPWPFHERPRLIDERCDRYEEDWRAAAGPRIEDYLEGLEGETRLALWLELVLLDQELRQGRGEAPTLADYRESCPDRMVWLELSTDDMGPIAGAESGTRGIAEGERPAAPIPDRPDPDRTAAPGESCGDPAMDTVAGSDHATEAHALPSTAGPPPDGEADGLDGLAGARPGALFGDYELLDRLGAGGMGVVFKARQRRLNRLVALKMIKSGALADERHVRLFRAEAEAVAALDHPQIVPVLDSGEHLGMLYYSMKLVDGRDLGRCLSRYADRPRAIAQLVATIAEAIAHAHRRGVLHRDLKPSNILIDDAGAPHVIDFGLALRLDATPSELTAEHPMGTPGYMSPEQARGRRRGITTASDVYGLGTILYALLTGRPPFSGGSALEILHRVIDEEPPRPRDRNPRVDPDLETICLKCLDKDPAGRYPSARELAEDLGRWLDGRPIVARPASRAERVVKWVRRHRLIAALAAAAVVGGLLGIAGLAWGWLAAAAARDEALRGEDVALRRAYAAGLNLAERDWRDANIAQVVRRLDEARPPAGKAELRGFEWYYLDRLARSPGRALVGHADAVSALAYSPDGSSAASGDQEGQIRLWEAATGRLIHAMAAHRPVWSLAFHPDGTRLASAGAEGSVILWDAATGQRIRDFPGHTDTVFEAAFSPDGKALASSGRDGTIRLVEADTGRVLWSRPDHRAGSGGGLAFLPGGRTLLSSGGGERSLRYWDVADGRLLRTLKDDAIDPDGILAISPDGKVLAHGGVDGAIGLRDPATGSPIRSFKDFHNRDRVAGLAFDRDGKVLAAAASFLGRVTLWDVAGGEPVRILKGHTSPIWRVAFSPDGVHLATSSWDQTVRIWDATQDQESRALRTKQADLDVAFGPTGSYLASGGLDREVTLRDVASGRVIRTLSGHTDAIHAVAISPDGRRAASASDDRTVRIWEVATGAQLQNLQGHTEAVSAVAFSPDGKVLASGSNDRSVRLWDVDSGRALRPLGGHAAAVRDVAFTPDGKLLATAGMDGLVILWDPAEGTRRRAIRAGAGGIEAIAISQDGGRIASGGTEPVIKIWDVATGTEVLALRGHGLDVHDLAFSPDGLRIAVVGGDRTVRLWETALGQEVLVLRGHSDPAWGVAFSPDGHRIASAGGDRTIRLWEAESAPGAPR